MFNVDDSISIVQSSTSLTTRKYWLKGLDAMNMSFAVWFDNYKLVL